MATLNLAEVYVYIKNVYVAAATYTFFIFLFRCFINLFTDEAVLNIIVQASGLTKLIFMRWKQEALWAVQSLNMNITDFGYLGINLGSIGFILF